MRAEKPDVLKRLNYIEDICAVFARWSRTTSTAWISCARPMPCAKPLRNWRR